MKKILHIIAFLLAMFLSVDIYAQGPPDPDPDPSGGNNDIGGGAPIDSGTIILVVAGILYASSKYKMLVSEKADKL